MEAKKKKTDQYSSINIYLPKKAKEVITEASNERGLTISSFLRMVALERIRKDEFVKAQ